MEFILIAALWILITCLCKIVFTKIKQYVNIIPESALQIFLGLALAAIFSLVGFNKKFYVFDAHTFFAFLLFPIIFDAGYFMPNREFFENFDSIMTFAVFGTVFNTFAIGFSLALLNSFGIFSIECSTSEMLLFASLISAVDPVAVIAVFEEMHVNKPLFVNVFGEALFNDAISVVLFGIFKSFTLAADSIQTSDYFFGLLAFFVVSIGGVLIGLLTAFVISFATKFTTNTPIIAPILTFTIAYIGYVISEICSFSSIIAAAVCGMTVKQFIKRNIDSTSFETIGTVTRNFAISFESLTFILLGLATISVSQHWDTWFVLATIGFCLLYRFIAILLLYGLLHLFFGKRIAFNELFIICFGGLRGAIAFGVVLSMPDDIKAKDMFVTATLAVIFFSVVVQGTFIRPLLKLLKVKTLDNEISVGKEDVELSKMEKKFNAIKKTFLTPLLTNQRN